MTEIIIPSALLVALTVPASLAGEPCRDLVAVEVDGLFVGIEADARVGESVVGGRDVTHDGAPDVAIGAPGLGEAGGALVASGTWEGVIEVSELDEVIGPDRWTEAGASVSMASDLTGDGYPDLVIGAPAARE